MSTPAAHRANTKPAAKTSAKPAIKLKARLDAKRRTGKRDPAARKPLNFEMVGIGLITLGIALLLATRLPSGVCGVLLNGLQWCFGIVGAWGISIALILLGISFVMHLAWMELSLTTVGVSLIYLVTISLLQLGHTPPWDPARFATTAGGLLGGAIAGGLSALLGGVAWVVLIGIGLTGVSLVTEIPLWMLVLYLFKGLYVAGRWVARPFVLRAQREAEARRRGIVAALQDTELRDRRRAEAVARSKAPAVRLPQPPDEPLFIEPVVGVPSKEQPEQLQMPDEVMAPKSTRPYTLPPVELLTCTPHAPGPTKDDTTEKILALEETLASFGIEAKVVGVERGPRVTRFEIVPPPGIRINRITNLADNIALSLAALDVRVEAPVPGKGVVGIEVPNRELVLVELREIIESDAFRKSKSPLTFALGRDITGHPRCADLSRMPHLLIAGATNSGKSVCINTLLCSILMRATPQQVKLLLVDPKRVELSLFQHIPHLIAPVAYDAKHAAGLLRWAIREMEQRYEMFADKGVRNIVGFNEQSRLEKLEELPYIVIIIDELADLMMQAAAEFEASICRIAQLARATGIHLVVATQRPSVNVITGTIKANIPSRIAFAVASQVDSRTILDMNGAERLVGQGDMLYQPIDASKPARLQGAYVSEVEINRIVSHVKEQGKPQFSDEIVAIEEEAMRSGDEDSGFNDEPEDELFDKALDYVRTTKYASTSMLQRKFRIGYTRAARLMDIFEERGYVGPGQGSKPREVIFAPTTAVTGRVSERFVAAAEDDANDDDE